MVVIVESPDNCGKSTQLEILRQKLAKMGNPVHCLHYSSFKLPREECIEYSKEVYRGAFGLAACAIKAKQSLLFDRMAGGETVYGSIYRNYAAEWVYELERDYLHESDDRIKNTFLIVFTDTPERLISRDDGLSFTSDMGYEVALEKKKIELDLFEKFFHSSRIKNKILIDIRDKTIEEVAVKIGAFLGLEGD